MTVQDRLCRFINPVQSPVVDGHVLKYTNMNETRLERRLTVRSAAGARGVRDLTFCFPDDLATPYALVYPDLIRPDL
jgi:hypothetical protein